MALSPRVLSLAALPSLAGTSTHLQPGVHLRWTYHPLLGFPNGPVEVSRASLDGDVERGCERRTVHLSETGQGTGAGLPTALGAGQRLWCRPLTGQRGTLAVAFAVDGIAPERVVAGLRGASGFIPVQYGSVDGSLIWVTSSGVDAVMIEGPGASSMRGASTWAAPETRTTGHSDMSGHRSEISVHIGVHRLVHRRLPPKRGCETAHPHSCRSPTRYPPPQCLPGRTVMIGSGIGCPP